jgi:hypothetical protein
MNTLGNRELRAARELTTAETDQVGGGAIIIPFSPGIPHQSAPKPLLPVEPIH